MQNRFGLLNMDMMPIFHNHCLDILITMRSSINCSAVICSPTVIHAILREATSETYGPQVSFLLYCISFIYIASRLLFRNLYFPIYTKKIPKIFTLLSLLDLTFASDREGIVNPFITLVARFLFAYVGAWDLGGASYWIDTLVLKTEGNTYATLLHHPFLFREIQRKLKR